MIAKFWNFIKDIYRGDTSSGCVALTEEMAREAQIYLTEVSRPTPPAAGEAEDG